MSRKHYIAIAAAIKSAGGDVAVARAIADVLGNDNPLFDRARFLAACGVPK